MADLATATPPAAAPSAVPAGASTDTNGKIPAIPAVAKPDAGGAAPKIDVKTNPDPKTNEDKPFLLKIDGKEVAMSRDEVIAAAQKGQAAEKRLQEAAKQIKEANLTKDQAKVLFDMLRTKDGAKAILTSGKLGIPIIEIAQEILAEKIKLEMMSDQERELHEAKKKLSEAEEDRKRTEDAEQEKRFQELKKHWDNVHEKDIMSVIESSDLPKSRWTVQQMARYMHLGLQRGVELRAADVVDLVRKDFNSQWKHMIATLPADKLLEMMEDPKIKEVSEALIKRARPNGEPRAPEQSASASGGEPEKKISKEEWRKRLDQRIGKI